MRPPRPLPTNGLHVKPARTWHTGRPQDSGGNANRTKGLVGDASAIGVCPSNPNEASLEEREAHAAADGGKVSLEIKLLLKKR